MEYIKSKQIDTSQWKKILKLKVIWIKLTTGWEKQNIRLTNWKTGQWNILGLKHWEKKDVKYIGEWKRHCDMSHNRRDIVSQSNIRGQGEWSIRKGKEIMVENFSQNFWLNTSTYSFKMNCKPQQDVYKERHNQAHIVKLLKYKDKNLRSCWTRYITFKWATIRLAVYLSTELTVTRRQWNDIF